MPTINLGKIGITPRGEWSAGIANYSFLDLIAYEGGSYLVKIRTGNVPSGTLPTNTTYFQQLSKKGEKGADGTGSDTQVLGATVLSITAKTEASITLNWTVVPNATSYKVERAKNAAFTADLTTVYTGPILTYINTGLTPLTTYFYRIQATAIGTSYAAGPFSTASTNTNESGTPKLASPVMVADTITALSISLLWSSVANATSYQVQRATNASFTTGLVTVYTGSNLGVMNTGLQPSTAYWFRIKATAAGYLDSDYQTLNVTTKAPEMPKFGIVNNTARTFDWTNSTGYNALSDYEYTLNGGTTYQQVTAKPIVVGDGAYAAGQVGVRVKAIGSSSFSDTLFDVIGFTEKPEIQYVTLTVNINGLSAGDEVNAVTINGVPREGNVFIFVQGTILNNIVANISGYAVEPASAISLVMSEDRVLNFDVVEDPNYISGFTPISLTITSGWTENPSGNYRKNAGSGWLAALAGIHKLSVGSSFAMKIVNLNAMQAGFNNTGTLEGDVEQTKLLTYGIKLNSTGLRLQILAANSSYLPVPFANKYIVFARDTDTHINVILFDGTTKVLIGELNMPTYNSEPLFIYGMVDSGVISYPQLSPTLMIPDGGDPDPEPVGNYMPVFNASPLVMTTGWEQNPTGVYRKGTSGSAWIAALHEPDRLAVGDEFAIKLVNLSASQVGVNNTGLLPSDTEVTKLSTYGFKLNSTGLRLISLAELTDYIPGSLQGAFLILSRNSATHMNAYLSDGITRDIIGQFTLTGYTSDPLYIYTMVASGDAKVSYPQIKKA